MNARVLLAGFVAIVYAGNLFADSTLGPSPVRTPSLPDNPAIEAPPIPAPPAESATPMPPSRPPKSRTDDPFQQPPRDKASSPVDLAQASSAFADRQYGQAAAIYTKANQSKLQLTAAQRDEWAYCRLHAVAVQLNQGNNDATTVSALAHEVDDALRSGSDKLLPFGKQLLDQIRQRGNTVPKTKADWLVVETSNFRLMHRNDNKLAVELAQTAESARRAMYERWAGPPAGNWSPRCDVYLHPSGAEYARATGKSPEQLGHSTVEIKGRRPTNRKIELRADDATILDATLPSEVTQVILAELFADEPLPRWAVVGIAGLSETPESVARYRRAIPGLLKERKLAAVGPFFDKPGFPEAASITSFYAQSVSLVSFLVERRGPKAFLAFLREGPRRGYAKAIVSHYGFKDMADLQDKWVRHSMGAE